MLSGSAVPVSHDARTPRTHIFSDRPLIRLQFVKAQELYRHCPRSALFISASRYTHLAFAPRSEEHTSELQSHHDLVCRLLLEKKKTASQPDIVQVAENRN